MPEKKNLHDYVSKRDMMTSIIESLAGGIGLLAAVARNDMVMGIFGASFFISGAISYKATLDHAYYKARIDHMNERLERENKG